MFFGRKPSGYFNQPTAVNMVNQAGMPEIPGGDMSYGTYQTTSAVPDGMIPQQYAMPESMMSPQHPMGYVCEPCYTPHPEPMPCPKPEPEIYVVRKGDTVYKIAQKYGLDWRELAGYNRLGNPDLIYPGERLFIPPRY